MSVHLQREANDIIDNHLHGETIRQVEQGDTWVIIRCECGRKIFIYTTADNRIVVEEIEK